MRDPEPLIPKYGGYRKLKSYRMAQLVHDVTALFCERFVDEESRTWERMMQAAQSGAQKIAEGSQAGEESKKAELKLTNTARASLDELRLLYVGFLRQQQLPPWPPEDPRRSDLVAHRPKTVDDVEQWAEETSGQPGQNGQGQNAETLANGALTLIAMAFSRLDRQLSAQTRIVQHEARIAEQLRRRRLAEWPE